MIYNRVLLVMNDETDARAAIAKAEQAASTGDYAGAERHLGEAVALQRASLGPTHPDLANTLNNLGVACEYVGKLDDAEQAYRQAYAIALQVFEPDHPFVTRSTENLRDFCRARGRPFAEAPLASSAPAESSPSAVVEPAPVAAPVNEHVSFESARVGAPLSASHRSSSSRRFLGIAVALAAIAIVVWGWRAGQLPTWGPAVGGVDGDVSHGPQAAEPPLPVRPLEAGTVEPKPDTSNVDVAPRSEVQPPERQDDAGQALRPNPVTSSGVVAEAQVCQSLSRPSGGGQWLCDPVGAVADRGTLVFYTRIRSRQPATVEHRWYLDGRLDRRAELHVGANPGSGYRTFSRNAMTTDDRAGSWRVELRARDGTLLHEQRFDVP